jgi:hypothetical protein
MHRDFSLCVGGWVKEEEKGVKRKWGEEGLVLSI